MPSIPRRRPDCVDTVVIGNGPSALILSYILSGHIPYYTGNHHDQHLHNRLVQDPCLLNIDPSIYDHLKSSLRYSTQALPFNVLLDTLFQPDGDASNTSTSCIEWRYRPDLAVNHIVLGDAPRAGGQWADNPVNTTSDIGTLSYAEQLSLPGYSIAEFWQEHNGEPLPELMRPSRTTYAEYLAIYPFRVGIASSVRTSQTVSGIVRTQEGFHIASHVLDCKAVVLASGTFSRTLSPPCSLDILKPRTNLAESVLIVGSGFTAADLIISTPPDVKIIHIFNWDPENRASPLKGCHSQAYPEYSWIYRQMKLAATRQGYTDARSKPSRGRNLSTLPYFSQRDWTKTYVGFANADVTASPPTSDLEFEKPHHSLGTADPDEHSITVDAPGLSQSVSYTVGSLHYAAGRRGSLSYLSPSLRGEVIPTAEHSGIKLLDVERYSHADGYQPHDPDPWTGDSDSPLPTRHASFSHICCASMYYEGLSDSTESSASNSSNTTTSSPSKPKPPKHDDVDAVISGSTFRSRIEASLEYDLEMAPGMFVIGSLTGDSLVRYATGGCCHVAGKLMRAAT